jgi:hypothetical protein
MLTANKQAAQNFDVERFNLRKLNELEGRKQYQIKTSNRFVVLENLNDSEDIHRVWENIKESIKSSAKDCLVLYELKQHKSWFNEEYLRFQIKEGKMQRLWNTNQRNVDNLNIVRRVASEHFRKKKRISES